MDSVTDDRVLLCRVSPFGNLRIDAYVPLPGAYRSLSRPSSAPDAKAFPLRSYQLDHSWFSEELCRLHRSFLARIVVCYPIIPQYFCALSDAPSVALLFIFLHCSVFKVQIPDQRPDQNVQKALSVLIHSLVEISGFEPLTSCVQSRRSPN